MITKTFARVEDGILRLEADVIPAIVQDDDRRLIFIHKMISYATKAQQEVYGLLDSQVLLEVDMILRRKKANEAFQEP